MSVERIVIVAGETSGDNLAAGLIRALRARRPGLTFQGVAGPAMRAAGCEPWASAEELSVMGLFEVLRHLPALVRLRRSLRRRVLADPPLAYIGVDAPEFNLGLAAQLHARGIPAVQYVSPQVWAWRQGRVRRMAGGLDLVLCLLPFEKPFYDRYGLAAEFVGHPLADRIPLETDRAAARERLGLAPDATWIALLPGSRRGEVLRLAADFIGAATWLGRERPGVRFVAAMANPVARDLFVAALERARRTGPVPEVTLVDGESQAVLTASDCVLVASGTATLETLLCRRPMVVAYRVSGATMALVRLLRLIKAPFFSQPNLLAERAIVPELLQEEVTPERLGRELLGWLDDPARVAAAQAGFAAIHARLRQGASERAADAVLALLDRRRPA
jgi:lipid-A-disaccharide synthase